MASLRSPGSLALTPTDGGFRLYTKAQRRPHPAGTAHEAARVLARGDGRPGRRPTVGPGAQQRFQQHAQEQGPAQGDPERRPWQFAGLRGEGRFQEPAGHTVPTAPPAATRPASPRSRTPLSGRASASAGAVISRPMVRGSPSSRPRSAGRSGPAGAGGAPGGPLPIPRRTPTFAPLPRAPACRPQ